MKKILFFILTTALFVFVPLIVFAANYTDYFKADSFTFKNDSNKIVYAVNKSGKEVQFPLFIDEDSNTKFYRYVNGSDTFILEVPVADISKALITKTSGSNSFSKNSVSVASTTYSTSFKSMFCSGGTCANYDAWINGLWNWGLMIIIPLSVLMVAAAGVIYTTSAGNPDRIGIAKKMLFGVLSGVGLLILSKILLTVIGVK